MFSAKSENRGAICESKLPEKRRTFADEIQNVMNMKNLVLILMSLLMVKISLTQTGYCSLALAVFDRELIHHSFYLNSQNPVPVSGSNFLPIAPPTVGRSSISAV